MKWNELISLRIAELAAKKLAEDPRLELLQSEESLRRRIEQRIKENFEQEKELTEEVYKMMEDLERQGQSFERQKIFPMLRAQLAKKKGIIL